MFYSKFIVSNTNILENFGCLFNFKSIWNLKKHSKIMFFLFNFKKIYCHEIVNFWIIYHWYYYLFILYPWKSMHRSKIVKKPTNFRQNPQKNFKIVTSTFQKFSIFWNFIRVLPLVSHVRHMVPPLLFKFRISKP